MPHETHSISSPYTVEKVIVGIRMKYLLLFICLAATGVAPIRSGPVRELTEEDQFFRSLSATGELFDIFTKTRP